MPRLRHRSRSRSLDRHTPINLSHDGNRSTGLESRRVPSRGEIVFSVIQLFLL